MNDPQSEGHMASHIGRRKFLATLGGAVAVWPLAARAQQPAVPVIGYLGLYSPSGEVKRISSFRKGLKEAGFDEGRNVTIEFRFAEGDVSRLPTFVTELVSRKVKVMLAASTAAALAAKTATSTVPIVFTTG